MVQLEIQPSQLQYARPVNWPRRLLIGALAGLAASAPMTLAMAWWKRWLPGRERYPLPPREITVSLAHRLGLLKHMDEPQRTAATSIAHFGYGAATGALYGVSASRLRLPAPLKGIGYAMLVWLSSYMGWLPALAVLAPASQHPARRNALMIGAHLVWGATMGLMMEALAGGRRRK